MSTKGFAKRRDKNEPLIVAVLEALGAVVQPLSEKGVPDLLVGHRGSNVLIEVKSEKGKLTDDQCTWHDRWSGERVWVVRTPEDAVLALRCCPVVGTGGAGIWTWCPVRVGSGGCDGTRATCPFGSSHARGTYPRVLKRSKA